MKNLGLTVAAFLLCATMSFAQSNQNQTSNELVAANFSQLSKYLELQPSQLNEVEKINDYFIEAQKESFRVKGKRQEMKQQQALYGNLKLMKQALTAEQYRKYLQLLNVTYNNRQNADYLAANL